MQLAQLYKDLGRIIGQATYEGAKVVADEVKKEIEKLPDKTGVTKRGLIAGFGITKLREDDGFSNVKLGFDGYNEDGVANQLMARIFESGTSKTPKRPFVRPAVDRTRTKSIQAMDESVNKQIEKLMK